MSTLITSNISDGTTSVGTGYVVNGSAKSWVNLNGTGTVAIRDSLNVSSVTDNGVGDYTLNFTDALNDANYATTISYSQDYGVGRCVGAQLYLNGGTAAEVAPTTTQARFATTTASSNYDAKYICASIMGDLA